jgi:hypothetical protein
MATSTYPKGVAHILGGATAANLASDNLKILFYAGSYSSAHEFVADLTGASIIARSGNLASKTVTSGVLDAADVTVTGVSGAAFTHVILYKDTGSDATSVLLLNLEITSYTPNGGDINVIFNASGIYSIA